jgi:thiol:disulfide interchange protein DsbA
MMLNFKTALTVALTMWIGLLVLPLPARAAEFEEGVHYVRLPVPVATADDSRVEVVECFSYACIHCKTFDPVVEEWQAEQGDGVQFRREPAIFNPTWQLFAQAFFTAELLEVTEQVHTPIFKAIHEQGMDLRDPNLMAKLFETFAGVPKSEFDAVYFSFGVHSRLQQAKAHNRAYGVTGTPSMIVDGQFRTDGQMAGSNAMMLQVVDYLVQKQGEARGIDVSMADEPAVPVELAVEGN